MCFRPHILGELIIGAALSIFSDVSTTKAFSFEPMLCERAERPEGLSAPVSGQTQSRRYVGATPLRE
jgi:hypothetical protein